MNCRICICICAKANLLKVMSGLITSTMESIIFDTHGSFEIQYSSPLQILLDFAAHSSFLELVTSAIGCDPSSL